MTVAFGELRPIFPPGYSQSFRWTAPSPIQKAAVPIPANVGSSTDPRNFHERYDTVLGMMLMPSLARLSTPKFTWARKRIFRLTSIP
jgi:hypothetical protein